MSPVHTPAESSCQSSRPPLISSLKGLSPAPDAPQQIRSAPTPPRPLTPPFWERIVMNLISLQSFSPSRRAVSLPPAPRSAHPWPLCGAVSRNTASLLRRVRCNGKRRCSNKVVFVLVVFFWNVPSTLTLTFDLFSYFATFLGGSLLAVSESGVRCWSRRSPTRSPVSVVYLSNYYGARR